MLGENPDDGGNIGNPSSKDKNLMCLFLVMDALLACGVVYTQSSYLAITDSVNKQVASRGLSWVITPREMYQILLMIPKRVVNGLILPVHRKVSGCMEQRLHGCGPVRLLPPETVCVDCQAGLSDPTEFGKGVTLYTRDGPATAVQYRSLCPGCGARYFYGHREISGDADSTPHVVATKTAVKQVYFLTSKTTGFATELLLDFRAELVATACSFEEWVIAYVPPLSAHHRRRLFLHARLKDTQVQLPTQRALQPSLASYQAPPRSYRSRSGSGQCGGERRSAASFSRGRT